MCGRYTNTISLKKLADRFGFKPLKSQFPPRYNIAPGQEAPVVVFQGANTLEMMLWGLVPRWAKEKKMGYKMINARAETLHEKPSFKRPFQGQRCLVLADSFYEWKKVPGSKSKIPMRIVLKNREPFAFAGLWDKWTTPEGKELYSFTIVTTQANDKLKSIHDRMPVILDPNQEATWLDPDLRDFKELKPLLKPYKNEELEAYPVSTTVNSPKNDIPACIVEVPSNA